MQEDALSLFHTGLREYMGVYGDKKSNGWGVTGLSVSASKILAIPQVSTNFSRIPFYWTFSFITSPVENFQLLHDGIRDQPRYL